MRKKKIIELISSLERADEVLSGSKSPGYEEIELLKRCQETAILIGNELEKKYVNIETGGDSTREKNRKAAEDSVHYLEAYCESGYEAAVSISEGGDINNIRKLMKVVRKNLGNARRTIEHEIGSDNKTVVFLPYKASMWDSLESLYKKAAGEEGTDAFVVPIPYYERDSEGNLSTEHYEGNDYPEDIPITDYREYDLESELPDEIYIHNPYDDRNYVTSVHPFFYSTNLKKFTEKLIYVPYFVLQDPQDPDNEAQIKGLENFVLVPGVFNSDKTIVQSENMRKAYINILTSYTLSQDKVHTEKEIRTFFESRIDGSGSPKFDKIRNTSVEDLTIPEEWKQVIDKKDGGRKKIFLYNTGVSALLQNDEKMLEKIERVFQIFYENREEIALLWRPHPLIESTLTSMRPDLYEKYMEIKNRYISGKWGIFDDTPDMDRAIILSDAYYGDGSSLVQLYGETGKPIMIQNPEV